MNKFTMLVTAADVANNRREGETMWQTKERLDKERKRDYLRQPWMPDFEAVRDKRMSELTPEQQKDAHELWLREQMDHMAPYYQEHLLFLLNRLDEVRAAAHTPPRDWHEYQRIADLPAVFDALHDFAQDPTGDNGVMVVQAALEAVAGEQA